MSRQITYLQAVREAQADALSTYPEAFLIGEEIGTYGGVFRATEGLQEQFGPARVRDTPIAETSFVGIAAGAALVGARPIVEIMFMDFIACAVDPIVNHAAKLRSMSGGQLRVPMIVRTQGGTGTQHGAQHSQMLETWFTHVPGLFVIAPSTPQDYLGLFRTAMQTDDPVLIVEHRRLYKMEGRVEDPVEAISFGHAATRREGRDLTIVASSYMVVEALQAAERLHSRGIDAEVIDPRTLVPLDLETILRSVRKTSRFLVVHESVERSGWGAEVVSQVIAGAFDYLDAPPLRLGAKNVPIPFGQGLEQLVVPQVDDIVGAAARLVGRQVSYREMDD